MFSTSNVERCLFKNFTEATKHPLIGWMGYSALSSGRTHYKRTPHHRGSQLAAGEIIKPALNRLSRHQIGRRQGGGRVPGLRPMAAPGPSVAAIIGCVEFHQIFHHIEILNIANNACIEH